MLTLVEQRDRDAALIRNRAIYQGLTITSGDYTERYRDNDPIGDQWKILRSGVSHHWIDRLKTVILSQRRTQ